MTQIKWKEHGICAWTWAGIAVTKKFQRLEKKHGHNEALRRFLQSARDRAGHIEETENASS